MKIGWLVWRDLEDKEAGGKPELWIEEPPSYCSVVVQIVYSEIVTW
jgi:hypothetical protein